MRKLGRKKAHRQQMFRNLTTSVILYEKVETTRAKAKEIRSIVEKMINLGKDGTLTTRRQLLSYLFDKNAVKKIYEELVPRYKNRESGYLRFYNLGSRLGDGAPKVLIQLIPGETKKEAKPEKVLKGSRPESVGEKPKKFIAEKIKEKVSEIVKPSKAKITVKEKKK